MVPRPHCLSAVPSKHVQVEQFHKGHSTTMDYGIMPSWCCFAIFSGPSQCSVNSVLVVLTCPFQQTHWDCAHLCASMVHLCTSWTIFIHAIQSCHHQHHLHPAVFYQVSPPFSSFHLRRCPQPTWQFHQRFHDKALPPRDTPPDAK